jgi:GntR family transcriptional regulator, arabinose operon transcriptional repressor
VRKRSLTLDLRDERSAQPKYERLKEHLINEMITGRLKPGQALPSLQELVKSLGIARMTVCQAMASLESDGLIRRVQGKGTFVEDDARRKLRCGQDIFALIVLETRGGLYPSLLRGFDASAADINHRTMICSTDDDLGRQAEIILQLIDQKVGGVAINPTNLRPTPAYQIRQLQERGIPVVFIHRGVEGIAAPVFAIPFYEIGRMAGRALVDRGHRRVALFTTQPKPSTQASEEGFRAAFRGVGEACVQCVHVEEDNPKAIEESTWSAMQQVFSGPLPPTAIFANDGLAEVVYLRLPELGLRTPEDVSLVGFGAAWRESALSQRLTSVVIDEIETGRRAVSLLHQMRRGERPIEDNEQFILGIELSEGSTLAEPPR